MVLALVIDATGTVKDYDLSRARRLAPDLVTNLPPGSQMAVIAFKNRSQLLLDRTSDVSMLELTIGGLSVGKGRVVLNDALYYAGNYLRQQPGRRKAIVVISDGRDTGSVLRLDESLKQARDSGFPIFTIGVGKVDSQNLCHIAEQSGGQCVGLHEANGYLLAAGIEKAFGTTEATPGPPPARVEEPRSSGPIKASFWVSWASAGIGLCLLAVASGFLVLRRKRRSVLCSNCGTPLSAPGDVCINCTLPVSAPLALCGPQASGRAESMVGIPRPEVGTRRLDLRRASLWIQKGPGAGNVFDVNADTSTMIGRSTTADVALGDLAVSQHHCRIRFQGGTFLLQDLKSSNGTFVNDTRTAEHILEDGDMIRLGETVLVFRFG